MLPEFHAPPSAVDVCVVVSLFVQVTVPPTATEIGFGANAVVVRRLAPRGIETAAPGDGVGDGDGVGAGVGLGDGAGDTAGDGLEGDEDPQPINSAAIRVVPIIRKADMCLRSPRPVSANAGPHRRARFS